MFTYLLYPQCVRLQGCGLETLQMNVQWITSWAFKKIFFWIKSKGDGRKFLDRFKSYFGSQISSQLLNEVYIYRITADIRNKRWVFFLFFFFSLSLSYISVFDCFWVGVMDCKWRTKSTKCCWISGLVKQATTIKNHGKSTDFFFVNLRTLSPWVRLSCQNRQ